MIAVFFMCVGVCVLKEGVEGGVGETNDSYPRRMNGKRLFFFVAVESQINIYFFSCFRSETLPLSKMRCLLFYQI